MNPTTSDGHLHDERPTILIVDDVPANLQVIGELLQPEYRVLAANCGSIALRIAATAPAPDLILLDIMMPDLDGYEVLSHLKEAPATRDIPVIFLTALDSEEDEARGLELGAVDFIAKPIKPAIVLARVRNHLELKRARDTLSQHNESLIRRLDQIFLHSLDILCIAGFNGYFKEISPAFSRILGWRLEDAHKCPWLEFVHPEDAETAALGQKALTQGQPLIGMDIRFRHREGHYRWLSWNAFPVLEEKASFCVIRDVTAHKHAEEQLTVFNDALSWMVQSELTKNREKDLLLMQQARLATMGELIHNISHHWRQPLNALGLLLANIKDAYEFNELSKEYLDDEIAKGHRLAQGMSSTIDEFRKLFQENREMTSFSLNALVNETLALLASSFESLGITVSLEAPQDISAWGFPADISQILVNLLNNARDAIVARKIPHGTIRIRIAATQGEATLSVKDNGGGIPDDILPKIFDPYFTTRDKGVGIGLYISRMLLTHQNGRIEAFNQGDGAQLVIFLPIQQPS